MRKKQPRFLPVSMEEARRLGIDEFDVVIVSGDAYVDHPSFPAAVIGRVLWDAGFSVGIIPQPDWRGWADGACDSMVNNYTPAKKRRSTDVYSPGGRPSRPDRAALVYADKLHALFPEVPVVLGGIEASLRRFAHYDYWSDRVRQSVLADAPADILVFGMGEAQVVEIARRISAGLLPGEGRPIPGTVEKVSPAEFEEERYPGLVEIPPYTVVAGDPREYARAFAVHYGEQDPFRGRPVAQRHPKCVIVQNPPAKPLSPQALDAIYELPFAREAHPSYDLPIPALEPVRFSLVSHRGCFGGCSFCAIAHHQGRIIQSRSIESLVREASRLASLRGFSGVIADVGGPTANMYGMRCDRWEKEGTCAERRCTPACMRLHTSHAPFRQLLSRLSAVPGVRKVLVSSGVRHDLLAADGYSILRDLCEYHVPGHLKVAPEHVSPRVLSLMGKPGIGVFLEFCGEFERLQEGKGKKSYILPYFMSGHPGCTVADMIALAEFARDHRIRVEQVQDFTPTPMTVSTCMYHTGLDPFTMEPVHVPRGREKRIQRALLQYWDPRNRALVREALLAAGRGDLVGQSEKCLVDGNGKERVLAREPSDRAPRSPPSGTGGIPPSSRRRSCTRSRGRKSSR
ncbi:MAG: YgiQ family radical SAM protein [Methanolinea sp.]